MSQQSSSNKRCRADYQGEETQAENKFLALHASNFFGYGPGLLNIIGLL